MTSLKKTNNKHKNRRHLTAEDRKRDAKKWLQSRASASTLGNLVRGYSRRYRISEGEAQLELWEIGYGEEVRIQYYKKEGIEWEFKMDGYTGEMKVVPLGTPEWELHWFD